MIKTPKTDLRPGDVLIWTGGGEVWKPSHTVSHRKEDDTGWWIAEGGGLADYAAKSGPWIAIRYEIKVIGKT